MNTKKIKKNMNDLEWEARSIVATPYGSLVKTYQILNGIDMEAGEFIKLFKKAEFPFLEDPDFIKKTLEAVGYEYINIVNKPVATCENKNNCIFCPFIVGDDEIVLLPLFKDRSYLHSQEMAMANDSYKIIDWRESEDDVI